MARNFSNNRKENKILHVIPSNCMMEYITDAALSRKVELGRFVSRSEIINKIVRSKMIDDGWECE